MRKRVGEALVAPLKKVVRVVLEELQIALKPPEAGAEFLGVSDRIPIARNKGCHILKSLARDVEHRLPVKFGDQCLLISREGLSAPTWPLEVDRIAHAERDDTIESKRLLAEHGPDVARLLTCDRAANIDVERRSRGG